MKQLKVSGSEAHIFKISKSLTGRKNAWEFVKY
jgi:hypothetical protein